MLCSQLTLELVEKIEEEFSLHIDDHINKFQDDSDTDNEEQQRYWIGNYNKWEDSVLLQYVIISLSLSLSLQTIVYRVLSWLQGDHTAGQGVGYESSLFL